MDSCENQTILFNKEGFIFSRVKKNNYKLEFSIENNYINIPKIIDFNLVKLIYDLNPDIYEKINIQILNEHEAVLAALFKHFCEDLGLPQNYSFLNMKLINEEKRIIIKSQTIYSYKPEWIPSDTELMKMDELTSICNIITPHKVLFSFHVTFNPQENIPTFAEKTVGVILFKIFKRVKQFIENVRI
jgi:ADP-glucose pyrophosphorylase